MYFLFNKNRLQSITSIRSLFYIIFYLHDVACIFEYTDYNIYMYINTCTHIVDTYVCIKNFCNSSTSAYLIIV